ncbi:D-alanyl-D-alanine carboxypeptidase family protein [Streptomyces griseoviridis]|uniref:D-alanyl-D-alanine carboxypeptidase family protein n=1 Tax=Streptomyces griseoviridis TaxID=45398 RepID=UPI003412C21C
MTRGPESGAARTGGVDTATRVFAVRDADTAASDEERAEETGTGAGGAEVPEAVAAAWVRRGAGPEAPEPAEAPGSTDAKPTDGKAAQAGNDAGGKAEARAKVPAPARGDAGPGGKSAEDTQAGKGDEDAEAGKDGKAGKGDAGKAAPRPTAPTAPGTEATGAPEAPEAPTAPAGAAEGDETPSSPSEPATDGTRPATDGTGPAPGATDTPEDGKAPANGKAPGNGKTPEAAKTAEAPEAARTPAAPAAPTAPGAAAPAASAAEPAVDESADRGDGDHDGDAPKAPSPAPKPGATDAKAEPEPEAESQPKAAAKKPEPSEATPGDAPEPDAKTAPAADTAPDSGTAPATTPGDDPAPEPLDHPTTVFKAPRPAKPEVDQPTTMLKLGTGAERASKFVALKPLDEPQGRPPAAGATSSVPQVGPELTTQQPLPPKPPLDLLAELTNTPPPPQTPVRTLVRRVKIWTPLVLLLILVFAIAQAFRPLPTPTLALTAADSYTFDGSQAQLPWPSEGQGSLDVNGIGTMGAFGKQTPVAIGSVAKAMTAYIVLKDHPMKSGSDGEKIKVDALAEKEGGYDKDGESTLNTVKAGDVLTERDALSAIMIPSANNIARLLARWDAGSEAEFIKKMNDTAKELGMENTTYTDASGLKETTVSTAEDQVKLGNELVRIPALMEITRLPSWKDPSGQTWQNYNRLVPYNGALGIKTGTTTKAGGNLLFAATKDVDGQTVTVVGAILGQHTAPIIDTVNAVSKTAMVAAQDALKSAKILKKGDVVGYVDDRLGGHTPIVVTKDVSAVGWSGLKVKLSFDAGDIPHTAKAGTTVGTLTVGDGDGGAVKVPVQLQRELAEPGLGAKLTRIT